MEDDERLDRARQFGRSSLGFGLAGLILPFTEVVSRRWPIPVALILGVIGLMLSLPALDARSSLEGSKPGVPIAGLVASLLAIALGALIWFLGFALSQHGPRAP